MPQSENNTKAIVVTAAMALVFYKTAALCLPLVNFSGRGDYFFYTAPHIFFFAASICAALPIIIRRSPRVTGCSGPGLSR
jgi:hypothetical protein